MDEVIGRARRLRRKRVGLVAAVCTGAAAAAIALLPRVTPSAQPVQVTSPTVVTNVTVPSGTAVFAAGTANGRPWQLSAADIAQVQGACLPAVTQNGTSADPLSPSPDLTATPAGAVSVITGMTGVAGVSFVYLRVPQQVTSITVVSGKEHLTLTPQTQTVCSQHFRLAGFGFATANGALITANPSGGSYQMPTRLPASAQWQNLGAAPAPGTLHPLASGTTLGYSWTIGVRRSGAIACLEFNLRGARFGYEPADDCSLAQTYGVTELIAMLNHGLLYGYAVNVGPGVSYVTALPESGGTRRVRVKSVGDLRVAVFAVTSPLTGANWPH